MRSQTSSVRFWIAISSILIAIELFSANMSLAINAEYKYTMEMAPLLLWVVLFFTTAIAKLYGVMTSKYNTLLLILEPILATAVWAGLAFSVMYAKGHPDALFIGVLVNFWLLCRYPTHSDHFGLDDDEKDNVEYKNYETMCIIEDRMKHI